MQLFRNGPDRPRTTTEYVLKLAATVESDFSKLRSAARRPMLAERWAPLSPVDVFARNCAPSRKALDADDLAVAEDLKIAARGYNRGREVDDQPEALLGWVGCNLHGAGTVRSRGMAALVFWVPRNGVWVPTALVTHPRCETAHFVLERPTKPEGRSERASEWYLPVYSPAHRQHLEDKKAASEAWKARQEAAQ